jgi:RNA polymerase sigma factor (sigma-70 family)
VVESTEVLCEEAFRAHWTNVFRVALAWTNDWGAAEDIAQEAFVRLWTHRHQLDWSTSVLPWLLRAARNLATDRFRKMRRLVSGTPLPSTLEEGTRDRWINVRDSLARLSNLERSALVSTTLIGLSYAEAAALLGVSEGATRSAVSRARTKLEAER